MRLIPKSHFGSTFIHFKAFVSSKNYDKRDDFDFDIVHFPFLDGDPLLHLTVFTFLNLFDLL